MKNQCNFVRKSYLDVLRIIAIFMVLFNHTGSKGFAIFTTVAPQSVSYWIYLFGAIFIKIAVPIFFMISGALLLEREESIEKIIKKRFLKYSIILLVSSFIGARIQIVQVKMRIPYYKFYGTM